ncbi:hypothetical protein PR048_000919 [Dryococelus australis]|uniref:Uncharacterized protein n=1 Tax=Dryococelus australis TaxID=614101 RepID=A0ABQ9IIC6_9NEOP|nr:hypothetical protein PR048_000919 [Dryococelus australis]
MVRLLTSQQGEPGSIPCRFSPDFRMWESWRTMPLIGGFSLGSPPFFSFNAAAATEFGIALQVSEVSGDIWAALNSEVLRADEGEARYGAAPECNGGGTGDPRENPPTSTITTCENPGAAPPGIESDSPRWERCIADTVNNPIARPHAWHDQAR